MPFPGAPLLEIEEAGLVALTTGARKGYADLTDAERETANAAWAEAQTSAGALIRHRLGAEPSDATLAERVRQAGAVYFLSRKPGNVVSKDTRDGRLDHFEFLLGEVSKPTPKGSITDADGTADTLRAVPLTFPASL